MASGRPRRTDRLARLTSPCSPDLAQTGLDCHSHGESANAIIGTLEGRVQTPSVWEWTAAGAIRRDPTSRASALGSGPRAGISASPPCHLPRPVENSEPT